MTLQTTPDLDATPDTGTRYQLGAPIALAEFLALPPDGVRYDRDEDGRLVLMSPDDPLNHRLPMCLLTALLNRALAPPLMVMHECAVALPEIYSLQTRERIRESFLGPKLLQPDLAVFDRRPTLIPGRFRQHGFDPAGLRLAIELLSPSTWRTDVGRGEADAVDRWRSYWASQVPEYWILNVGVAEAALPVGSGLFLTRGASDWTGLPAAGRTAVDAVHGVLPVRSGTVTSAAVPGLVFDLDAFMSEARA